MRRLIPLLFLPLLPLQAADPNLVTIRLYAEGNPSEGETFVSPIKLLNPPKDTVIRKIPIVNERDIAAFYPFTAPDGSIGAYFKLDAHGSNKLSQHTIEARDTMVVAMINERIATAMMVDKKITDGILLIPNGFLPQEVVMLQAKFPIMGKEKEFSEQKKKAQTALKEYRKNLKEKEKANTKKE